MRASLKVGIYALSVACLATANFLTAPVLIRAIGIEEFARWSLAEPILLLVLPISLLGLNFSLMKRLGPQKSSEPLQEYFFPCAIMAFVSAITSSLVVGYLFESYITFLVFFTIGFAESMLVMWLAYWRGRGEAVAYALADGGRAILTLLLTICISVWFDAHITTANDYMLIRGALSLLTVSWMILAVKPRIQYDIAGTVAAARFGLPIVVGSAVVAAMMNFDRYPVEWAGGSVAVASYVAHARIAQAVGSAVSPFTIWYTPKAMAALAEDHVPQDFFRKSFVVLFCFSILVSLAAWSVTPHAWALLFPEIPMDRDVLAWLILGSLFFVIGNNLAVGVYKDNYSIYALGFSLAALFISAALCVILGAVLGPLGVAAGRALGFGAYSGLMAYAGIRAGVEIIAFPWFRIALMSLHGIAAAVAISALSEMDVGVLVNLIGGATICLLTATVSAGLFYRLVFAVSRR